MSSNSLTVQQVHKLAMKRVPLPRNRGFFKLSKTKIMAQVIHTVDVTYGSYNEKDYEVVCDENDDLDDVKAKVRRLLDLNFLPMATYRVKITNTRDYD